jgi:hypothetical protein
VTKYIRDTASVHSKENKMEKKKCMNAEERKMT